MKTEPAECPGVLARPVQTRPDSLRDLGGGEKPLSALYALGVGETHLHRPLPARREQVGDRLRDRPDVRRVQKLGGTPR